MKFLFLLFCVTLVTVLTTPQIFVNSVNGQLVITVNRLNLFNGENITLTSQNLFATENGQPAPSRVLYRVTQITNGQFRLLNPATNQYTPITQFTQEQLNNRLINFLHTNNQQLPSYTLQAQDSLNGLTSVDSTVDVTFSAFNRNTIGAPRPVFQADIDPVTLVVTLRITVFKRVFTTATNPEVNFNIGLSRKEQCSQSDFIRDFQLSRSTNWFNTYIFTSTLNDFMANPNVQQITNGPVIDLVTNMFATYMITQVTTWPGTNQQEVNCYQVVYSQRYCLSLALAVTRVGIDTSGGPDVVHTLKPVKIFVNDFNKLEVRFLLMTTLTSRLTSFTVTGPYVFTVTDAVLQGTSGTITTYDVVLQSNVISGVINFFGDYVLRFSSVVNSVSTNFDIPYSLQYLTVGAPILQQLIFNTTALTFADRALTIPKSQFALSDTINVRVDAPGAADLQLADIGPYNVALCCYLPFQSIPNVVDCRSAERADFSTNVFINGQAVRSGGLNTDSIATSSVQTYGFQFDVPVAIRDNIDRRCFLTIESSYQEVGKKKRKLVVNTQSIGQQIGSLTQKLFDLISGIKGGDQKNNNGTNTNTGNNNKNGAMGGGGASQQQLWFTLMVVGALAIVMLLL
ncbi:hypothetical protein ABK040_000271 [Willaertia magna]